MSAGFIKLITKLLDDQLNKCSTTMKTEKITSKDQWLGRKPATISSCTVHPPEIVMHDNAFNVILWTSADICVVVVHDDDLRWKNQTARCNCRFSATSLALREIGVHRKLPPIYVVHDHLGWKNRTRTTGVWFVYSEMPFLSPNHVKALMGYWLNRL